MREEDSARVSAGRSPIVFVTDAADESARIADTLRIAGYVVVDVPLSMLVARAQVQRPHVVLVDVDAPTALEEIGRLRRQPGGGAVDFIYFGSGGGIIRSSEDAMVHEGSAFFLRPVEIAPLVRRLESLTGGPSARPEARPSTPPPSLPFREKSTPPERPSTPSLPAPGLRTPGPPLPMSTPSLADLVEQPRSFATFGTVSNELQQLLAEAELRADVAPSADAALPSPEEEIETVLPADVLASLDEPIEADEDEDNDVRGGNDALGAHAKGTTAGGSRHTTATGRPATPHTHERRVGTDRPREAHRRPTTERHPDERTDSASITGAGTDRRPISDFSRPREVTPAHKIARPTLQSEQRSLEPAPVIEAPKRIADDVPTRAELVPKSDPPRRITEERIMPSRPEPALPRPEPALRIEPAARTEAAPPRIERAPDAPARIERAPDAPPRIEPAPRSEIPESVGKIDSVTIATVDLVGALQPPNRADAPQRSGVVLLRAVESRRFVADAIARRASGALCFEHDRVVRRLVMREGDLVTAASGAEHESLVAFLGARGELPKNELERLAAKIPPYGRHAGAALVAHGWLSQDQLWTALRAHAEWIAMNVLRLGGGTAQLEEEPPGRLRGEPSVFGASTGAEIFVELVRRAVAPDEAIEALGGEAARIGDGPRSALLSECALPGPELELVARARGGTIADLLARATDAEIASVVHGLSLLGVLEALPPPEASRSVPNTSADLEASALDEEALRARIRARLELVDEGDYFAVLGVQRDATSYEVRRAFIELRRAFEPSQILSPRLVDLTEDVRKIVIVLEEAYEILRDGARRERYRRAIEARPA